MATQRRSLVLMARSVNTSDSNAKRYDLSAKSVSGLWTGKTFKAQGAVWLQEKLTGWLSLPKTTEIVMFEDNVAAADHALQGASPRLVNSGPPVDMSDFADEIAKYFTDGSLGILGEWKKVEPLEFLDCSTAQVYVSEAHACMCDAQMHLQMLVQMQVHQMARQPALHQSLPLPPTSGGASQGAAASIAPTAACLVPLPTAPAPVLSSPEILPGSRHDGQALCPTPSALLCSSRCRCATWPPCPLRRLCPVLRRLVLLP